MPDDAYTEMKLLRMAYRLLVATNQLDDTADAVIAEQTMHVLLYGTRQAEQEDEGPPEAATIDEELVPSVTSTTDIPQFNLWLEERCFPNGRREPSGFTIPARVAQLGYTCTPSEAAVYGPALIKLAREEWRHHLGGTPLHANGEDVYGIENARWIDPLIHASMAKWRAVAQAGEGA